jgi:hypothetical protein
MFTNNKPMLLRPGYRYCARYCDKWEIVLKLLPSVSLDEAVIFGYRMLDDGRQGLPLPRKGTRGLRIDT